MTLRRKEAAPGLRQNQRRQDDATPRKPRRGRALRVLVGTAKVAALLLGLAGAVWGGRAAWQASGPWLAESLRIHDVYVVGNQHLTRAEIVTRLQLDKNATLYTLDDKPLIERLKTLPWIKEATITRLPLHGIEVTVVEREPAGVVQGVHANVLVDREGMILKWIGQTTDEKLPVVTGVDIKRLSQAGSRERRTVREAFELAALVERVEGRQAVIDGSNPMNLVVSLNDTRVLFGQAPFQEKWTLYQQLKPVLVAEHGESLAQRQVDVDLRFIDRVIVRERG